MLNPIFQQILTPFTPPQTCVWCGEPSSRGRWCSTACFEQEDGQDHPEVKEANDE